MLVIAPLLHFAFLFSFGVVLPGDDRSLYDVPMWVEREGDGVPLVDSLVVIFGVAVLLRPLVHFIPRAGSPDLKAKLDADEFRGD